ncbi:MAG: RHS repeat-associated core domain-containing protein, partial [Pirellulaceae bacterium]|nr:RHS repeat-associated core domain-containing protein [Pirellulaceae bacterium]
GNVLVSVTATNMVSRSISLTFRNGKAGINLPQTTINTAGLFPMMGGGISSFANTTVEGGAYQEIQTITLSNATSGTWRVAYNGEISTALATSITAAGLKSALDAFVGIDNVTVTGSSGSFTVTFGGTQSSTNMSQIFGDAASASCGATIRTITSAYNANDQLTSISDPSATINFTLDNLGRATSISNTIAGLTPTVTLAQNFNAAGNRTELKATIGSTLDFRNTYQFDTLGRVTEMIQQSQAGGNAVTAKRAVFEYNKLNQRTSLTRYQSTGTSNFVAATDYTYDTVNRLSGLTHKQSSTVLAGYTYGYDGLSRLTSVTSTIEGLSTYTYDATSQVVGADHAVGGQADETYGFDLNGNRNTSGYTTSTNNHTTADPGFTYTYDDQGNHTSRTETATGKVTEYSWDHRNRLVTVKDRNTAGGSVVKQVDYAYDAFNRLVKRTFDADGAGSGTATNQFWVYDEGINAVLQFDGSSASNLSHRYLWSDRVDELLADETVGSGADTLYALGDHLGTIRDIANFNESTSVTSVTNHRTYNSFGKLVSETNAAVDLIFGYTGKQLDEATGLQHNLFRWYDSGLGQWLSEDPLGFAAGDENVRRYVGNHSLTTVDPIGLQETIPLTPPASGWPQASAPSATPLPQTPNGRGYIPVGWPTPLDRLLFEQDPIKFTFTYFYTPQPLTPTIPLKPAWLTVSYSYANFSDNAIPWVGAQYNHSFTHLDIRIEPNNDWKADQERLEAMVRNYLINRVIFVGHGSSGSLGGAQAGTDAITYLNLSNALSDQRQFLEILKRGLDSQSDVRIRMCYVNDTQLLGKLADVLNVRIRSTNGPYFVIPLGAHYYTDPKLPFRPYAPPNSWYPFGTFPTR